MQAKLHVATVLPTSDECVFALRECLGKGAREQGSFECEEVMRVLGKGWKQGFCLTDETSKAPRLTKLLNRFVAGRVKGFSWTTLLVTRNRVFGPLLEMVPRVTHGLRPLGIFRVEESGLSRSQVLARCFVTVVIRDFVQGRFMMLGKLQ